MPDTDIKRICLMAAWLWLEDSAVFDFNVRRAAWVHRCVLHVSCTVSSAGSRGLP
jgi:hypothetical protein